ncbi:hypothetical protein ALTERO38_20326 [Alteromonas sp. 38]|nr:hypothetical protein ALTER154_100209 [Alteromonas sp. 154]VXB06096.1 hypothetical protein ALTERO38_20326 [Alteromonas sp. 38]
MFGCYCSAFLSIIQAMIFAKAAYLLTISEIILIFVFRFCNSNNLPCY